MTARERLHRLVDELPHEQVPDAERTLKRLRDHANLGGHKVVVGRDAEARDATARVLVRPTRVVDG